MHDPSYQNLKLSDLALACFVYDSLTPFNISLHRLKELTYGAIDLSNPAHRTVLLNWLNDWGCRHLSKESHHIASDAILDWHNKEGAALFTDGKAIWELSDSDMETVATAYGTLKDRIGAHQRRGGQELQMSIGPTAASKILFTIRSDALMPWDEAMRFEYSCDGSKESYIKFLIEIRKLSERIISLCRENGFNISELPRNLERDGSTVLELINEYIWVTVTRKCKLPSIQHLTKWTQWEENLKGAENLV